MMNEIKRLIFEFPNGTNVKTCDHIAQLVDGMQDSKLSSGGFTMLYMPLTREDEQERGCEFAEDEMTYTYGYKYPHRDQAAEE